MTQAPTITSAELSEKLGTPHPPILLDVRLEDDFRAAHLPGAANNCVFEVAFLERMTAIVPDQAAAICVYGASDASFESRMAAEKLARAGFLNISELREGLAGWTTAGFSVEKGAQPINANFSLDGRREIDLAETRLEWTGRNLLNKHSGHIRLKSGCLEFHDGIVCGGEFVIDMNTITCDDLAGSPVHDILIAHLQSDDFFDVALHPEARIKINSASPVPGASPGSCNLRVHAELTLKAITKPIEFTASTGITAEGKAAAQATFSIDRTEWNVLYGSGKFFQRLAGHLVNDLIDLQLRIVTV